MGIRSGTIVTCDHYQGEKFCQGVHTLADCIDPSSCYVINQIRGAGWLELYGRTYCPDHKAEALEEASHGN